jgi:pimeloyl-ACP methyl ester carboxylesterase
MEQASASYRCLAMDLPGIGGSTPHTLEGDKFFLARVIREAIDRLGLRQVTLVGHDVGGMIGFAYLKQFSDLNRAVIMDTVIPGISPWQKVLANPYLWHFAFHAIPELPEKLVKDNLLPYFSYFYDALSANKYALSAETRQRHVSSYSSDTALTQGFNFYRAFGKDVEDNQRTSAPIATPVLYLRGSRESSDINEYEKGLADAGIQRLTVGVIKDAGHFAPEEAALAVWAAIAGFLNS